MFELTELEKDELVTNCDRLAILKHSSVNPLAFTEQGVPMLSDPFHTLDELLKLHYKPENAIGNMIIEGDNLIALKALLPKYDVNVKLAEKIKVQQPGRKRIVYAPSCFLDEEYLTDNQIDYVGILFNLFQRR